MRKTLLSLLSLAALSGCDVASDPAYLSKAKFGATWPFTTESVLVGCDAGRTWVQAPNGKKYGLNGLATSADKGTMYEKLDAIWLPDAAAGPGGHKDLSAVMAAADKQCSN